MTVREISLIEASSASLVKGPQGWLTSVPGGSGNRAVTGTEVAQPVKISSDSAASDSFISAVPAAQGLVDWAVGVAFGLGRRT